MRRLAIALWALAVALALPAWGQQSCTDTLKHVDERLGGADLGPAVAGLKQMRDQAAAMCAQGQEAMALQLLGMLELSLPPTASEQAAAQAGDQATKAKLTNEFLAGTWCSMTGEERSQLVFSPDGSYRFCVSDTVLGAYGACSREARSTEDWLSGYARARSVEQDSIELGSERGGYATFRRGECSLHGR